MKKLLLLLCLPMIFSNCSNENEELKSLNLKLYNEVEKLSLDLDECINGSDKILGKIRIAKEDNNYDEVKSLFNDIRRKHRESLEFIDAKKIFDEVVSIENKELERIKKEKELEEKRLRKAESLKYPNMLGRWELKESNYLKILNSTVRIYRKGGNYYRSMLLEKDGSESILKLKKRSDKRYDVIGKSDYLIINSNSDLEFWDKEGYLLTCKNLLN